jgi:hypothetical protein
VVHICNLSSLEAEAGDHDYKPSLGFITRPHLKNQKKKERKVIMGEPCT